jgi:hypothetical protein
VKASIDQSAAYVLQSEGQAMRQEIADIRQALETKIPFTNLVNDLTATEEGYALDARQGPVLLQTIEDAESVLRQEITRVSLEHGVSTYTHTKSGTVHNLIGEGPVGRILIEYPANAGDTFQVNGNTVAAFVGDKAVKKLFQTHWAMFVFDGARIDFMTGDPSNLPPNEAFTFNGTRTVSEDSVYYYMTLLSSGTLVPAKEISFDVFLVGGGGGGGGGSNAGGSGGGGGYTRTYSLANITTGQTVVIGAGGAQNASGGTTYFGAYSAPGGGAGGINIKGGNGGSGGGGAGHSGTGGNAGAGGANGGNGGSGTSGTQAGGTGQGTTTRAFGGSIGEAYSGGGGGANNAAPGAGGVLGGGAGRNGNGASGTANTGGGGGGGWSLSAFSGGSGGSGIAILRWLKN